jgi:hypothetical protein
MSGGQQGGTTYQTSTSSSESTAPAAIEGALKNLSQRTFQYFLDNPNAPKWFPNGTVADYSPQTQQSIGDLYSRGYGSPFKTAAAGSAMDTLGGKYLDINSNPYFQRSLAAGFQPQTRQFMNSVVPGIMGMFSGAGRMPYSGEQGSAGMNALEMATDSLNQSQANAAAQASLGAYQTERGNQMATMGMLPSFQAADYQDLMARLQAGGMLDQKAQQKLDAENQKYSYEQTAQPDYLTQMAQRLQAIYPGGSTRGTNQSFAYSMPPSNPTADLLNTIMGGARTAVSAIPMLMSSDRGDKTDVSRLGLDPLTGLPMYAYRYKGDPKTYPKVVGPMAQDIAARGGAVRRIGGHRIVPVGGAV